MNAKKLAVAGILIVVSAVFVAGVLLYQKRTQRAQESTATAESSRLVRMHSPVLGPQNAPVTIVEFFDPACETCRAFYPLVKELMARHPRDVRLVVRYAPLHQGSDQLVKMLEAAKRQGKFLPLLEAVLQASPPGPNTAIRIPP